LKNSYLEPPLRFELRTSCLYPDDNDEVIIGAWYKRKRRRPFQ